MLSRLTGDAPIDAAARQGMVGVSYPSVTSSGAFFRCFLHLR